MKQLIRIVSLQACRFVVCVLLFHPVAAQAQQSNVLQSGGAAAPGSDTRTTLHADLVTRLNPDGIMFSVGGYRRWEGKGQVGSALGINPAYGQASIHGEWTPTTFAVLRLQYDLYRFFGTNGALLSFGNAGERFGEDEIEALEGKEESGFGHRIMFQPTLQAKVGPVIVRNRTDLAYYRFDGSGPFFYEWEYDTLLKDSDLLVANQTHLLYEAWKGRNGAVLLAGPYYEITRAAEAELTRQRAGGEVLWVPVSSLWSLDRPRVYSRTGVNLQDPNRHGEVFLHFGIGFDWDMK